MAIYQKKLPGDVKLLLSRTSGEAGSESALALRFLYSTLPQCWDFNPRSRPSVSTLLTHISTSSPVAATSDHRGGGTTSGGKWEIQEETKIKGGDARGDRGMVDSQGDNTEPTTQPPTGGQSLPPHQVGCTYPECHIKRISKSCSSNMCPRHCKESGSSCNIHSAALVGSSPLSSRATTLKRRGEEMDEEHPTKRPRELIAGDKKSRKSGSQDADGY